MQAIWTYPCAKRKSGNSDKWNIDKIIDVKHVKYLHAAISYTNYILDPNSSRKVAKWAQVQMSNIAVRKTWNYACLNFHTH